MNDTSQTAEQLSAPPKRHWTFWQRVKALGRLMVYSTVAFTLLGIAAAHSAYGDFRESALITGRQLAAMGVVRGQHKRVKLNGELMHLASATTDKTVTEVLDRMETACKEHAADLGSRLPIDESGTTVATAEQPGLGVLRENGSQEGWVGCLWQRDGGSWNQLPAKVKRFVTTGDLSDLGDLRYVYAKREGDKTHVISVWTDGHFHILKAFAPNPGEDTPGSDATDVPRPTSSHRLLTAQVEDAPYSVRLYDAQAPAPKLLAMYDQRMGKLGWKPVPHATDQLPNARVYSRKNVDLLIMVVPKQQRSFVSIVQMLPR